MGLIKAIAGAAGGVMADQWKEFFTCEALPADVLAVKGQKKTTRRSSNTHGDENIITSGSRIAVADGQCMLIVEQGKVVEVCAEPGEYTYDASTEPTIFAGNLGESIGQVASQTLQSLGVTNAVCELPVMRPLIAFDKQDIVDISLKIDTYETSVLPYEDCCTIFVAKHPVTKPNLKRIEMSETKLSEKIDEMVKTAIETREVIRCI